MKLKKLSLWIFSISALAVLCCFCVQASAAGLNSLTVEVSERTPNSITVTYKAGGKPAGYKVFIYNESTKKYKRLYKGKKTEYTFTGLSGGEDYTLAVRAYAKKGGKTVDGERVEVKTATGLEQVSGIRQRSTGDVSHKISWSRVDGADGYKVYYKSASTGKYKLLGKTQKTSCTLKNLKPASVYTYKVKAYAKTKNLKTVNSKASLPFAAVTCAGTVEGVKLKQITTSSYTLTWQPSEGAEWYNVGLVDESTGRVSKIASVRDAVSYTFSDLEAPARKALVVTAYSKPDGKKAVRSERSKVVYAAVKPAATHVRLLPDLPGNGRVRLEWEQVENADGYIVYISDKENSDYFIKKTVTDGSLSCTLTGLDTSRPTYIKVKTYTLSGTTRIYGLNSKVVGTYA